MKRKKKVLRKSTLRSGLEDRGVVFFTHKGIPYEYETEHLYFTQEHKYTPDFILQKKDGDKMLIEAKGRFTSRNRSCMKLALEQNPDADIRIVFQKDNYLTSKSKTKYTDWAKKNGFPFHVLEDARGPFTLPLKWIKELKK